MFLTGSLLSILAIFSSLADATGSRYGPWLSFPPAYIIGSAIGLLVGLWSGFEKFIDWYVLHLSDRRLAAIGILLILLGCFLALAQPLVDLLDLPVR